MTQLPRRSLPQRQRMINSAAGERCRLRQTRTRLHPAVLLRAHRLHHRRALPWIQACRGKSKINLIFGGAVSARHSQATKQQLLPSAWTTVRALASNTPLRSRMPTRKRFKAQGLDWAARQLGHSTLGRRSDAGPQQQRLLQCHHSANGGHWRKLGGRRQRLLPEPLSAHWSRQLMRLRKHMQSTKTGNMRWSLFTKA